jgi:DNA-binding LacI/PurR family transcriptional regulator
MAATPPQHKYRHIFDELHREIASGKYKAGQKLPSEAALVKRFGASRITVGRAVRDLRQEGLVERRAGSGTYARLASPLEVGGLSFGLLIPDLGRTEIFEPICQGMAEAPEAGEHALLWANANSAGPNATDDERAWQLCQQYIARKVSGVFFTPLDVPPASPGDVGAPANHRIIDAFAEARIPVVLLDRDFLPYPQRSSHDLVSVDNWRTGFLATEHLIRLGCRRIVFLSSAQRSASSVEERMAGYREALFVHGVTTPPELLRRWHVENEQAADELMKSLRPDGFVCANDVTAGRLMQNMLALGIGIPQDVRVIGMDDVAYASLLPVPLTTMHQPCRELGIAAMATMLERVRHPQRPARHLELECRLVVRKSCGANPFVARAPV